MTITQIGPLESAKTVDLDLNNSAETLTGVTLLYAGEFDNSNNTSVVYVKIYDAASATIGTTPPDICIPIAAGEILSVCFDDFGEGLTMTGLTIGCVTTPGEGGTTSPTNVVKGTLYTN